MGNSWTFLESTVGFILAVPELTPNMGLFWYFFTEMFEHFRVFFVCTFQINCFVYVYPLAARLKDQVTIYNNIYVLLTLFYMGGSNRPPLADYCTLILGGCPEWTDFS